MTDNVDIINVFENFQFVKKLVISYRFKRLEHLVADKYGNFFILPHFHKRRTTNFKKLDNSKGYIYHNSIKYYMPTLRKRAIKTDDKIIIHD